MKNDRKVQVRCPRCNWHGEVFVRLTGNKWPIDDAKCSRCFREDLVFVNLVRIVLVPDIAEKL